MTASRPAVGPFRVSPSPSPPAPQTPVSVRPPGPPASVRSSAAGAHARGDDILFLAEDD